MPDLPTLTLRLWEASQLAETRPYPTSLQAARRAAQWIWIEAPEGSHLETAAARLHTRLAGVQEVVPLCQSVLQRIINPEGGAA